MATVWLVSDEEAEQSLIGRGEGSTRPPVRVLETALANVLYRSFYRACFALITAVCSPVIAFSRRRDHDLYDLSTDISSTDPHLPLPELVQNSA